MEKPNPDNYNSTGFYLDDLEKYNHMNIPKEIIDKIEGYIIDNATLPAVRSQLKNRILFGYQLRDDEVQKIEKEIIECENNVNTCALVIQANAIEVEQLETQLTTANKKIESLIEALKKISQMSDCGSYENTIIEMKRLAQSVLNKDTASKGAVWVKASELKEINFPICIKMDGGGAPYYTTVCSRDELIKNVTPFNTLEDILYLDESNQGFVWDYSDIAIKFKHWIPEREFENENAAFSFFFEEVYNRTEKKI